MTEKQFEIICEDSSLVDVPVYVISDDRLKFDIYGSKKDAERLCTLLNKNEQLEKENQKYKSLLQDMGLLMSDKEVVDIRNEISDKLLKPLFKENGFDVDINTDDGFKIIQNGDFND